VGRAGVLTHCYTGTSKQRQRSGKAKIQLEQRDQHTQSTTSGTTIATVTTRLRSAPPDTVKVGVLALSAGHWLGAELCRGHLCLNISNLCHHASLERALARAIKRMHPVGLVHSLVLCATQLSTSIFTDSQ
jgi:hypothetical protein